MDASDLYTVLARVVAKPAPFSAYTASALWVDSHRSQQMLGFHLNPRIDVASRRATFINESAEWMIGEFGLSTGKRVIDFGCGPGLYATRLASCGASITGVDFSPTSVAYAREQAERSGLQISFHQANYLDFEPDGTFDLITMIMCDFCALSPTQRKGLLSKFHKILKPSGSVLLDVYSLSAFEQREEAATYEVNQLNGFWSPNKYYGFQNTFKYDEDKVVLDKYTIVEFEHTRQVYNWLQYFAPEDLEREFKEARFSVKDFYSDVAGSPYDRESSEFAVIANKV